MRLQFEGQATAVSGGVNFAGYTEDFVTKARHEVLCRVTVEVLKILAYDCGTKPSELLAAYWSISETVNTLAAAQYSSGEDRPYITSQDIPRGWTKLGDIRRA
jgi:hypothetical protein